MTIVESVRGILPNKTGAVLDVTGLMGFDLDVLGLDTFGRHHQW